MEQELQPLSDDIRRYFSLLWHWAWLLILFTVVAGVAAFVINLRTTEPIYRVTSTLMIEAPPTITSEYAAIVTSERLATTYAKLLTSKPILSSVAERLGVSKLDAAITARPVEGTQFIEVKVEGTDPDLITAIANTLVDVFSEQNRNSQAARYTASKLNLETQLNDIEERIQETSLEIEKLKVGTINNADAGGASDDVVERELSTEELIKISQLETNLNQYRQIYASLLQSYEEIRLAEAQSTFKVLLVEPAELPTAPARVPLYQNTALAAVVGLMVAIGLVFLIEALDNSVKGPDDVERHIGLPVIGVIMKTENGEHPIAAVQPRSPVAEAFRALRTNIQYATVDFPVTSILVTSVSPEEGKTVISSNLAVVLTQGGNNVILVDTDLRRPKAHKVFGLTNHNGLTTLFVHKGTHLDGVVKATDIEGLSVLTSGKLPPNPAELLASERMFALIKMIKSQSDVVIFDTPPISAVTDAVVLSRYVDGVILVVQPGETKLSALQQSVEQLRRVGANVLGVVFNNVQLNRSRYAYYYGSRSYYSYYHDYYDTVDEHQLRKSVQAGR